MMSNQTNKGDFIRKQVLVEINSSSVNIFTSLKAFLKEFAALHFEDSHMVQNLLHFSKNYLPQLKLEQH